LNLHGVPERKGCLKLKIKKQKYLKNTLSSSRLLGSIWLIIEILLTNGFVSSY